MNKFGYSSFDYLCDEPYFLEGIGNVRCPTLRDIRKIKYRNFDLYLQMLLVTSKEYTEANEIMSLDGGSCSEIPIFDLFVYTLPDELMNMLLFFLVGKLSFEKEAMQFIIYDDDGNVTGSLNSKNFDAFRLEIKKILGIETQEDEPQKFKNDYVRKMYEKIKQQEELERKEKKTDDNYLIDNMVRKYCTNNKVGINILNVWNMTYYQFTSMFCEYSYSRQCDNQDSVAANSFSYKKPTEYNSMSYMKRIK